MSVEDLNTEKFKTTSVKPTKRKKEPQSIYSISRSYRMIFNRNLKSLQSLPRQMNQDKPFE